MLGRSFARAVSRLLHRVVTVQILRQAPRQHNKQLRPDHQTRTHPNSSQYSHKEILVISPFSLPDKLKLIKDTFNAEIVYDV